MLEIRPLNILSIHLERLTKGRLWLKVIIALFLGAGLGILINPSTGLVPEGLSLSLANWLDLPGQIFMRLVQMIMIPLIFASIISFATVSTPNWSPNPPPPAFQYARQSAAFQPLPTRA